MPPLVRALLTWSLLYVGCLSAFVMLWWTTQSGGALRLDQNAVLGGSLAAWFGVQFGRASLKRLRERAAVGRADDPGQPGDGEFVAARGVLQTTTPMPTPFTGQAAVAYGYKVWRREKDSTKKQSWEITYWWGEGSVPCTLFTRQGSYAILSRLELDFWSEEVENTDAARAHFARFLQGVQPEILKAGIARPGFDWDMPLDGLLRRDRMRQPDPPPLEDLLFHEWVVTPDEPVVVMGRHSASRGGLVHDHAKGRPLRVLKGDVDAVRAQLQSGALSYGALALAAAGVAAVCAGSILRWHTLTF